VCSILLYLIIVMTFDVGRVPPSSNTRNVGSKSTPGMDVYPNLCVFYVMFCSVLCRSWDNQIPVQGVCQWPTRFIDSHVNSKLQKGGRTRMQRPDARGMQFYKASYDICPLRCECSPQHSIITHPPTIQIKFFWDLIVACSHGRTLKVEAENSPWALVPIY
jgi:hypothetical protein